MLQWSNYIGGISVFLCISIFSTTAHLINFKNGKCVAEETNKYGDERFFGNIAFLWEEKGKTSVHYEWGTKTIYHLHMPRYTFNSFSVVSVKQHLYVIGYNQWWN